MLSFRRPLPLIQGGLETLWGDLTFCHQADYVSCGFHPSSEKKQAVCHCIKAFFFLFHGSVKTGQQKDDVDIMRIIITSLTMETNPGS